VCGQAQKLTGSTASASLHGQGRGPTSLPEVRAIAIHDADGCFAMFRFVFQLLHEAEDVSSGTI
jgi:hypothetical protein